MRNMQEVNIKYWLKPKRKPFLLVHILNYFSLVESRSACKQKIKMKKKCFCISGKKYFNTFKGTYSRYLKSFSFLAIIHYFSSNSYDFDLMKFIFFHKLTTDN